MLRLIAFRSTTLLGGVSLGCEETDDAVRTASFGNWFPGWTRKWNSDWDFRAPKDDAKVKGKTVHLLLIRHGQYDLEKKNLTPLGREQAKITGNRISNLCNNAIEDHYGKRNIRISRIYHSDLPRAAETAEIVYGQLAAPGEVKLKSDSMLAEGWPCLPDAYDPNRVRPATLFADSARIEAVFRKYCHRVTDHKKTEKKPPTDKELIVVPGDDKDESNEEEYIVLICHQNIIRYFVCRALQLAPEAWLRFRGSNCGITEIIISDDGHVTLEKFADVGHLPVNMHTFH